MLSFLCCFFFIRLCVWYVCWTKSVVNRERTWRLVARFPLFISVIWVSLGALTMLLEWQEGHLIHACVFVRNNYCCIRLTAFSRTTWVSRHQKGQPFWILLEQEMAGWEWHQLDHMQIICTSLQTDNHASTSPLSFLQAGCPSCHPTNSIKALFFTCLEQVEGKGRGNRPKSSVGNRLLKWSGGDVVIGLCQLFTMYYAVPYRIVWLLIIIVCSFLSP